MTNNGWPGKPGVPLNPETRGAHQVGRYIMIWRPWSRDYVNHNGNAVPPELASLLLYKGPCLTPAEVEAQANDALKWRDAINDWLTNWLSPIEDHEKPSDALQRLIRLEVMAALDPKVSQSAADLVAAAHKEWLAELNHDTDALMENARRDGLEEAARWYDEQERFWMEKGREVSALDSQSGLNLLAKAAEHRKHAAAIRALKGETND